MNECVLVADHLPQRRNALMSILEQLRLQEDGLPPGKLCETPAQAIDFASTHACPIVFVSVDLPGMNGFTLIKQLKALNSETNFILLADRKEYIVQAMLLKLRLSGSILGQPDMASVTDQLHNLRYPLHPADLHAV